jgi:hypothetical protein
MDRHPQIGLLRSEFPFRVLRPLARFLLNHHLGRN